MRWVAVELTDEQFKDSIYGSGPFVLTREQAFAAHMLDPDDLRHLHLWQEANVYRDYLATALTSMREGSVLTWEREEWLAARDAQSGGEHPIDCKCPQCHRDDWQGDR